MFVEWLTHLTTPCQKPFRQMGYLGELIAIKHRHARCKTAWEPHLDTCKNLIAKAARSAEKKGSVVVLGSGQLLDIPIEVLCKEFDRVHLVDICHLRNSRKRTSAFTNVNFIEADISGTVAPLAAWTPGDELPEPAPVLEVLEKAGLVVSANLLAQLPLAPLQFIEDKSPEVDQLSRDNYARLIMSHHLEMLTKLSCPVTLISEVLHIVSDGDRVLEKSMPLNGLQLPTADQEWWWNLAPRPELSPTFDLKLRVVGISDLSTADYERTCRNTTLAAP